MMMTHKKSGFGSSSTRLPATSPVPKIAKGKRSIRKRVDIIQNGPTDMSAIEMLATLAGNLLTEDSKNPPIIPTETKIEIPKPETVIKSEPLDQDSCNEKENFPIINIPPLISSDSSAEMPLYKNKIKIARKEIVGDNSGDNSSGCTNSKTFRAKSNSRVSKKVLCSKYRKPSLNSRARSITDGEVKRDSFCNSKLFYTRQRTQFKKKKQFEVKNEIRKDHVKLSINSFKIPELIIEVSESTTVASLKKKVLEAMAAMLGDGLHIGVELQGRKFKNDNLSLAEAGINQTEKINNLDFSLEPKFKSDLNSSPQLVQEDSHLTDLGDPVEPLSRKAVGSEGNMNPNLDPNPLSSPSLNCHESDIEWAPSETIPSSPENISNSKAIVVHHSELLLGNNNGIINNTNVSREMVVMSPARKSKRIEPVSQRRIRRPFSVEEVEALVSAVEQLGTGRWRDVKIRAFDNAKHRTYVDLKDKWKTLVHTASIAPQQRRGEPVPQEFLNRVLAAQSYWSTQQAKLQLKDSTCHLLN